MTRGPMSISKMFIPKNFSINLMIAYDPIIRIKPINAFVILFFAPSKLALSPPDNIQLTAPHKSMKKKIIDPITNIKPTSLGIIIPKKVDPPCESPIRLLKIEDPKTGFVTVAEFAPAK